MDCNNTCTQNGINKRNALVDAQNGVVDRHGHLLPGSVDEGAELLDAYFAAQLERAEDAARGGDLVRPVAEPSTS